MPRQPRSVYRRRRVAAVGGLLAFVLVAFYLPFTLLAPVGAAASSTLEHEVVQAAPPEVSYPPYGASAFGAVGYEGVLGAAGSTQALPIASITKVITSLVVLDQHPLAQGEPGPILTFDDADLQFYNDQAAVDGTRVEVAVGSSLSEHDVIELMLMASANNYALSLARWAFGTPEAFIAAATSWLTEHGLTSTTIREPTGLDAANTSTAADLIEIGKLALENPVIAAIVGTPLADVPGIGPIENRNALLGIDGIDGIKTGTLDESGANLLFSADRTVGAEVVTIVGVVLGGPDQATVRGAVQSILNSAASGFTEVTLAPAGQDWASFTTPWGDTAKAVVPDGLSAVLWNGAAVVSDLTLDPVSIGAAGTDVGDLTFTVGERTFTTDVLLDATIDDPGPWWRLTHPFDLF